MARVLVVPWSMASKYALFMEPPNLQEIAKNP
jgi:hypothetical protein